MDDPGIADLAPARGFRRAPLRLSCLYGAFFLLVGVQLPFWPVWLAHRGMGPSEIGLLLAAGLWVRVLATPLVAGAADRSGARRRLMIALAAGGLAGFGLYVAAEGFWPLFGATVVTAAFLGPLMPLSEDVTLLAARREGFAYGRVRLWGSLSFIAAAVGAGWLLAGRSEELILWLSMGAAALTLAACLAVPERPPSAAESPAGAGGAPLRRLLGDRDFLLLMAAAGLIQSSHAVYYGFATLHWRAAGLAAGSIGWLWAEGVVAEIVLFALGGGLVARLGAERLLALAGVAGVLRWLATGWSAELWLLVPAQALHAFTFGAAHLAAMSFIMRAVAPAASASAQGLYSSLAMGAAMGVIMPASGALYAAWGAAAFDAMAGLAAAGAVLALLLSRGAAGRASGA